MVSHVAGNGQPHRTFEYAAYLIHDNAISFTLSMATVKASWRPPEGSTIPE
jgi:hypothetical protein